jgi:DNA polymerase-1
MSVARGIEDPSVVVRFVEDALRPRWVLWSNDTAATLVLAGVRIATCWDVAAVHRLLFGGWRADPACVWAQLQHLALGTIPTTAPADLFGDAGRGDGDPDNPIRPDGHLRPEWLDRGWCATPERLRRWAELAARVAVLQQARLKELGEEPRVASTARSESAAELLCVEMSVDGLPMDRAVAEGIIAGFVGRRPRTEAEAAEQRARRDAEVLRHAPVGAEVVLGVDRIRRRGGKDDRVGWPSQHARRNARGGRRRARSRLRARRSRSDRAARACRDLAG